MPSYSPPLVVQATSTHIPEAGATVSLSLAGQNRDATANQLLLHPGESSEIAVFLENRRDRPLSWSIEIKGDFPAAWSPSLPQAVWLDPHGKCDRTLPFQVPPDFFEHPLALDADYSALQINYQCDVFVYGEWDETSSRQLIGYQRFTLYVRPATTYLNFLPALYRENDFVGRFLAIIEQAFDPVVQTLNDLWAYLDPLTAPEALLPFLAHWVGWPLDSSGEIKQQRRLIRHAVTLYRWHGTRHGLRFYLHLYTGLPLDEDLPEEAKHIQIEEVFSQGFVLGRTAIAQDSMLGGGRPYHFIVRLRSDRLHPIDEGLVRQIIEQQKPAFCTYDLQILNGL